MKQYLDLMRRILDEGEDIDTERTGVGTIALFGEQLKFDLRKEFPAITTKKLAWKSGTAELLWFLKGSTNLYDFRALIHGEVNRFNDEKKTFWDDNYYNQAISLGYTDGEMGQIYGGQWRNFGAGYYKVMTKHGTNYEEVPGIDQVKAIIEEAKVNPQSRRLIVSAWNPKVVWDQVTGEFESDKAALPSCHYNFQINIVNGFIDLKFTMRSNDFFLGNPINLYFYATLLCVFARILGYTPRYLVASLGNVHIYKNHIDQCLTQLQREPFESPTLWINPDLKTLEDFENASISDFKLENYQSHDQIKAQMAV